MQNWKLTLSQGDCIFSRPEQRRDERGVSRQACQPKHTTHHLNATETEGPPRDKNASWPSSGGTAHSVRCSILQSSSTMQGWSVQQTSACLASSPPAPITRLTPYPAARLHPRNTPIPSRTPPHPTPCCLLPLRLFCFFRSEKASVPEPVRPLGAPHST
ncbi:hypothetical protein BS50DRAFT_126606 [Corynespora cassiicola Philippines]|uniref:Uncharacterized protein n=1 Tax=Corynespora cassiicola Philippines TaxID=1448308 RepID=A0A2T2NB58_CORCC|nr:hypothetical protein BS50DRAFT_126606 [Corynespora cassiicola Philippines]